MANSFKLKTKTGIGVTSENVYVVPGATTSTIIGITLANISGAGCLINVGIDRASADNVKLLKNVPLPQGSTLEFMQGNKIVLETTDTLTIQSDTHTSIDASITVLEMT
tara:strand:- start:153 stop:479 length:327 start_codon:yes stop_codon:yes gene_type:complete